MEQRERLIELIIESVNGCARNWAEVIADHLLANGVVAIDTEVVSMKNRPLISTVASLPIDEVIDLVKAKEEGRLIVPPCKVGDTVYAIALNTERFTYGIHRGYVGCIDIRAAGEYLIIRHEGLDDEPLFDKIIARFDDFGKTVFLSREEAEKAIAERSKE